jgi:hypothetical protein
MTIHHKFLTGLKKGSSWFLRIRIMIYRTLTKHSTHLRNTRTSARSIDSLSLSFLWIKLTADSSVVSQNHPGDVVSNSTRWNAGWEIIWTDWQVWLDHDGVETWKWCQDSSSPNYLERGVCDFKWVSSTEAKGVYEHEFKKSVRKPKPRRFKPKVYLLTSCKLLVHNLNSRMALCRTTLPVVLYFSKVKYTFRRSTPLLLKLSCDSLFDKSHMT